MCAVSGSPPTREVNRSHVLYGSLRRTRLSCPRVAASRAYRSRTGQREVENGPERDDSRKRRSLALIRAKQSIAAPVQELQQLIQDHRVQMIGPIRQRFYLAFSMTLNLTNCGLVNRYFFYSLTRSTYSPVLVSILISSPSSINGGT